MDVPLHLRDLVSRLAPEAGTILVGVSGGADSVALLRGLVAADFDVVVAHLDHSLRPESPEESRFVADLAAFLGVESVHERVDVASVAAERGWNLEDAARRVRYEFLTRSARAAGAHAVATAHTLDDQAETVLMQLLRGSAYLRGIAMSRGRVIRPLLGVRHSELLGYLQSLGQEWREDASNEDRSRLRSWLRHEVFPLLEERRPSVIEALSRHARLQRDLADYLQAQVRSLLHEDGFDQAALSSAHVAVQREAIRTLFDLAGVAPNSAQIETVRDRLGQKTPYRITLAPGVSLRLAYGRLEIARKRAPAPDEAVTSEEALPAGVPAIVLKLPDLRSRSRRPGDRIRLAGGSKSLADALIDRKVPREERDALRVLASGSRVLWAEGIGPASDLTESDPEGQQVIEKDLHFMRRALELAAAGARSGELPVGAVVVCGESILGEAHNQTEGGRDPTAHAELLAVRQAARARGDWRLDGCTLYVTLEPCPMCTGALLQSHLERVVFGASNRRDGALGTVSDLLAAPWKRKLAVKGDVLAGEAAALLSEFFAVRR